MKLENVPFGTMDRVAVQRTERTCLLPYVRNNRI
jgi:hypothetical protein